MAFDRDSNLYTMVFSTVMVVIVGGMLAFVSLSLNPAQKANIANEKMQNILQAIGIPETDGVLRDNSGKIFNDFVKRRITINYKGEILSDKKVEEAIDPKDELDAFNIDLRKEYSKIIKPLINKFKGDADGFKKALNESSEIHFPIFVCENKGKTYYVLSASGKGLWDDIWGYVGLNADLTTINGVVFDHKGETPGLGSKITEKKFQSEFVGKKIADATQFMSVQVLKPGKELTEYQVDGISGATFTGVGVNEMLKRNLEVYYNFFKSNPEFSVNQVKEEAIIATTANDSTSLSKNDSIK